MKYKVGDKVVVRNDLRTDRRYLMENGIVGNSVTDEMVKLRGRVVTIRSCGRQYKIDESVFSWTDYMFEGLAYESPKSLLQDLDVITYRSGSKRFVLVRTNTIHDESAERVNTLDSYNDELVKVKGGDKEFDIMTIERNHKIIWTRVEKSKEQLELEKLESEMRSMADKIKELKGRV